MWEKNFYQLLPIHTLTRDQYPIHNLLVYGLTLQPTEQPSQSLDNFLIPTVAPPKIFTLNTIPSRTIFPLLCVFLSPVHTPLPYLFCSFTSRTFIIFHFKVWKIHLELTIFSTVTYFSSNIFFKLFFFPFFCKKNYTCLLYKIQEYKSVKFWNILRSKITFNIR